jgi:glycosyltransferase involved in cell wall biosynthesis
MKKNRKRKIKNIGFISTRLAGIDGVTLETVKWAHILELEGYKPYFLAGELNTRAERSYLAREAHFKHSEIKKITDACFRSETRDPNITKKIHEIKERLKKHVYRFIERFSVDLLILENCLAIPINLPLGIALTEIISESGIPAISHHHDLFWERKRFLRNAIHEYLDMAFPPNLPSIQHVVINSHAAHQLSFRRGVSPVVIPNVMDFENRPKPTDKFAKDVKKSFGINEQEYFILQPTRVIKRKRIEDAIEIVSRLKLKARLVISHTSGDEGSEYQKRVKEYAKLLNVNALFVSKNINSKRGRTINKNKIYKLWDVYPHADLITYPSAIEGFGNAFLEAIYFKKPIVINKYPVYVTDIKRYGFKVLELDGFVTKELIKQIETVLQNPKLVKEMAEHNYALALKLYSYQVLRQKLLPLIESANNYNANNK